MTQAEFVMKTKMKSSTELPLKMDEHGMVDVELLGNQILLRHDSNMNDSIFLIFRELHKSFWTDDNIITKIYDIALSKEAVQESLLKLAETEGFTEISDN